MNLRWTRVWLFIMILLVSVSAFAGPAPTRIISVAPSITDTLIALGASGRIVGVSTYCSVPEGEAWTRVGGYLDPDLETMAVLKPDLILTTQNPKLEARLDALELPYHVIGSQWHTLKDIDEMILDVGKTVGLENEAKVLIQKSTGRFETLHDKVQGKKRPSVLFVVEHGAGSLIAVGEGNHVDQLIATAGGTNALAGEKNYPNLDTETLLAEDPDVIIDASIPPESFDEDHIEEARQRWKQRGNLRAQREDRLYFVPGGRIVQPGPYVVEAAEQIYELLHGDSDD